MFSEPAALLLDFVVGLGLLLLLAFDFLAGLEFYPPDLLDLRVVYDFELFLVLSDLQFALLSQLLSLHAFLLLLLQLLLPVFCSLLLDKPLSLFPASALLRFLLPDLPFSFRLFLLALGLIFLQLGLHQFCVF